MSWKSGHTTSQSWNTASNASSRIGCGSGYSSFQTKPTQPWSGFGATSSSSAKKTKPEDRTPQHQAKIDSCKKSKEKKKAEDQQRKVDIANTKNKILDFRPRKQPMNLAINIKLYQLLFR